MRNLLILLTLALAVGCSGSRDLRILTYNVRNGKGMDSRRDLDRTAAVIRDLQPDVVALQEIDSVTLRSEGEDVAAVLAEKCGMNCAFSKAIDFDGGSYGIAILSREKPLSLRRTPLPGREERRTMIAAEFDDYVFVSTHLSLTPEDRMASIGIIVRELKRYGKPLFIAGDWNATPDSEFIAALGEHLQILSDSTVPTYPADRPSVCIDYVAAPVKQRVQIVRNSVICEPAASDHRPVMVELKF